MLLPKDINKFAASSLDNGIFPPVGSLILEETGDGAGNYYGLYWQIGKEDKFPIVCFFVQEDYSLMPVCKNLEVFVDFMNETGGIDHPPSSLNDTEFFVSLTNKAKVLTKRGNNAEAIQRLELAVALFGECSETWDWLAENYYIIGQDHQGDIALANSLLSNYFFGLPSKKTIDRFNNMTPSKQSENHPVIKRRKNLVWGGDYATPFSMNYSLLLEIIEEFKSTGDNISAMLLKQNYGLLMLSESMETREKYGFSYDNWYETFKNELLRAFPDRKY